jgi:transposase InsO family protein
VAVSLARLVITAVALEGRSKSAVARDYGVSRRWVQKLLARYAAEGEAACEPRSRRPHGNPARIPAAREDEIIEVRKALTEAGLDAGAATIAVHLSRRHGSSPAISTIWRVLVRRGFVLPQPHKRPRASIIRFEADQPNERWQADITHWRLRGGADVEILNVVDDHSRLLVASDARHSFTAADVVVSFATAAEAHGLPASVLTDNAAVFTAASRGQGWVALERELIGLGVRLGHSRPYHPQTCGKVERLHQTLKRWLLRQPAAATIAALRSQLDTFRRLYNDERPHRALDRRTPRVVFSARPKAVPVPFAGPIPTHSRVRRDKVYANGVITLRHNSRLHHIGLGRRHAGQRVLVLVHELHIRVLSEDGELLRELTLDPTRNYQPIRAMRNDDATQV